MAVLDLAKQSTKVSSVILNIIYVAMKTCATIMLLVFVLNSDVLNSKKLLNCPMHDVFKQAFFS